MSRVVARSGFKLSTFDCPKKEESLLNGEPAASEESECESSSEEDSETDSDDEDEVIYLGRENLLAKAQSQLLLSRWLEVSAVGMVIV